MTDLEWMNSGWRQDPSAKQNSKGQWGIDFDGLWGFQCKDFSNAYGRWKGSPFTAGNAITLWTVPQNGWDKVSSPEVGDVYVKSAVFNGKDYGDTGLVQSVTPTGVWVIAQNQINPSLTDGTPPARVFYRLTSMLGYLRKKGSTVNDKVNTQGEADLIWLACIHKNDPEGSKGVIGMRWQDAITLVVSGGTWEEQDDIINGVEYEIAPQMYVKKKG